MTIGPAQLVVLGFDKPAFTGTIAAELARLAEADIVRVTQQQPPPQAAPSGDDKIEQLTKLAELRDRLGEAEDPRRLRMLAAP